MTDDVARLDSVLQFALLVAGEADDFRERSLGPIHLIKYAYLADLAYARRHDGDSFTGTRWQFYHFGPWSAAVHDRIGPALSRLGASRFAMQSDFGDRAEWVRWSLRRDDLAADFERSLPSEVVLCIRSAVKKFGADTPSLLDYVYRTEPMRHAAPMEFLDLSHVGKPTQRTSSTDSEPIAGLSAKKIKTMRARFAEIRGKVAQGPQAPALINPVPDARFDEVYFQGLDWLDQVAGEQLQEGETTLEFGSSVWKSPARTENDPS